MRQIAAGHPMGFSIRFAEGNHRTVAIKAAGFPVAFVRTVRYDDPWELPPRPWVSETARACQRLLLCAGLLTQSCAAYPLGTLISTVVTYLGRVRERTRMRATSLSFVLVFWE